jgi:hypothetical protein
MSGLARRSWSRGALRPETVCKLEPLNGGRCRTQGRLYRPGTGTGTAKASAKTSLGPGRRKELCKPALNVDKERGNRSVRIRQNF